MEAEEKEAGAKEAVEATWAFESQAWVFGVGQRGREHYRPVVWQAEGVDSPQPPLPTSVSELLRLAASPKPIQKTKEEE